MIQVELSKHACPEAAGSYPPSTHTRLSVWAQCFLPYSPLPTQMLGDESHPGIIPRSMQQIFDGIQKLEKDGWTFKLQVSTLPTWWSPPLVQTP